MNTITITHTDEAGKKVTLKHQYPGAVNAWLIQSFLANNTTKLYNEIMAKRDKERQNAKSDEQ